MPEGLVVSTDRLDFGPLDSGRAVTRQILLRNQGNAALRLSISDPGGGLTVDPKTLSIEPGSIARVFVKADTSTSSIHGSLRIVNDADAEQAHTIALQGGRDASAPAVAAGAHAESCGEAQCANDEVAWNGPAGSVTITRPDGTIVSGVPGAVDVAHGGIAGTPMGVAITRTNGEAASANGNGGSGDGTMTLIPIGAAAPTGPHGMSDLPTRASSDAPREGETPQPLPHPKPGHGDTTGDDAEKPQPGVSILTIGPASSVQLMGAMNRFYPQQLGVLGASTGGSFSLASSMLVPRVPLAFGESMEFAQQGSAVGTFDPGSGQVNLVLPLNAVDSGGNAAPVALSLTTGTVVTRNPSGVLISVTGTARSASGELRLVGLGKIPPGYRNGAEEQLVMVDLVGTLSFADAAAAQASNSGM